MTIARFPAWIDGALEGRCIRIRTSATRSCRNIVFDLRRPNPRYLNPTPTPLIERNPLLFWQCLAAILGCAVLILLGFLYGHR